MSTDLKVLLVVVTLMFGYMAHVVAANDEADHARDVSIGRIDGNQRVLEVLLVGVLNESRQINGKPPVTLRTAREDALDQLEAQER